MKLVSRIGAFLLQVVRLQHWVFISDRQSVLSPSSSASDSDFSLSSSASSSSSLSSSALSPSEPCLDSLLLSILTFLVLTVRPLFLLPPVDLRDERSLLDFSFLMFWCYVDLRPIIGLIALLSYIAPCFCLQSFVL